MISHDHRTIFVHIPKNGGTSIEAAIWPDDASRTEANLWMGFVDRYHNKWQTGGLQHLLARQVRSEVGEATYADYFSCAIVRNPWDRTVSQYAHMKKRRDLREFVGMERDDDLKRYLELISRRTHVQWQRQVDFVQDDDGAVMVDYLGRFESYAETARHILRRAGLPDAPIPHEKPGARGSYQDYYDDESRELVAELYRADIEAFGYTFDPDVTTHDPSRHSEPA